MLKNVSHDPDSQSISLVYLYLAIVKQEPELRLTFCMQSFCKQLYSYLSRILYYELCKGLLGGSCDLDSTIPDTTIFLYINSLCFYYSQKISFSLSLPAPW